MIKIPKRYLDTSIPICVATGLPQDNLKDCKEIMQAIEEGKEKAYLNVLQVAEFVYVLEGEKKTKSVISKAVKSLLDCKGLTVDRGDTDFFEALGEYHGLDIDFEDAFTAGRMRELDVNEIYSLDPHFDRMNRVTRLEAPAWK